MPPGSHGAADQPITAFAKGAASFSSNAGDLQHRALQYIGIPDEAAVLSPDCDFAHDSWSDTGVLLR